MSLQDRRLNMDQLRQAKPVGSSFPFNDPAMELERLLPSAAPQLGKLGYQPTSIDEMAMLESRSFATPAHVGMEHKASTRPYDPLSKYGLTMGEEFLDIFLGGDTRKVKKALETGEEPYDYFGQLKPVYDPAIEQAFVPLDVVAGAGLPRMLSSVGKFGLKHSPEALEKATRTFSGGLAGMKPTLEMTAYHGSPHKFDRFKMSKIGTGEGAQAYGHGLYFAESPKVAGEYQKKLSSGQFHTITGEVFEPRDVLKNPNVRAVLEQTDGNIDEAIARANQAIKKIPDTQGAEFAKLDIATLERLKAKGGISRPQGHLYEVDIPEKHVKTFLDWDAPLSKQPESVRSAISTIKDDLQIKRGMGDPSGEGIMRMLRSELGNNAKVSEYLNSLGIKGLKYYDAGSRGAGTGSRNLVAFDESIINPISRNGTDLSSMMKKLETDNGF